jgi:superfamily II DNA or RNA helicase
VDLRSRQIKPRDASRQRRTAVEILRRFETQPGQILADEVGMGKTFVALAVAVSVIEATRRKKPVVVMVPPSVASKWPLEWEKFSANLKDGPPIRATPCALTSGAEFLKHLDDPATSRKHLIFLTHGALSSGLSDPLVRLAIVQHALRSPRLARQRGAFPKWAERVIQGLRPLALGPSGVAKLLSANPNRWRAVLATNPRFDDTDDPIPAAVLDVLPHLGLRPLRNMLAQELPLRHSRDIERRLQLVRSALTSEVASLWREGLRTVDLDLPLLILDEAHHTKNPDTRLAGLFANEVDRDEADRFRGELGQVFERMLFLTATPFQLGHHELISVLDRFEGIRWDDLDRNAYRAQLTTLRPALDSSQLAALRLDRSWGRLTAADLPENENGAWWSDPDHDSLTPAARAAAEHWTEARAKARAAQTLLRPLVIRHTRPDRAQRRLILYGAALRTADPLETGGLRIDGPAVLPFLLVARAQALVAMRRLREHRETRTMFALGLASSFEAYARTRDSRTVAGELDEVTAPAEQPLPDEVRWYLKQIGDVLRDEDDTAFYVHPKVAATVERVVDLWRAREKTLVFCFYRATGRALRRHIAKAIEVEIVRMAAAAFGIPADDPNIVRANLDRFRERLFDPESPSRRVAVEELRSCLGQTLAGEELDQVVDLGLRFLRTYSFLVRYVDLRQPPRTAMRDAFGRRDGSNRTFREVVGDFGQFLSEREAADRSRFLAALADIEIGDIAVRDDEREKERLIANVRLANGSVPRGARERLLVAFNTPFYPEVLVASSVMAEGVDLHLSCRHVIHHDLDWNPSVIEQRTGRLDRMGSKGERTGQPVHVYEPFIEGARDEKQFRVMHDRERWFNVVMGDPLELDDASLDRLAERVPFPETAAMEIAMDLAIVKDERDTRVSQGSLASATEHD